MKDDHGDKVTTLIFDSVHHSEWAQSVLEHHPAPDRLTRGGFALHARNFGIIQNADKVVALPTKKGGGTAQGIRLAQVLGKPCWNLQVPEHVDALKRALERN